MRIEFSAEQELMLHTWAWGEVDAASGDAPPAEVACEPSGFDLIVSVSSSGDQAQARSGSRVLGAERHALSRPCVGPVSIPETGHSH
jgi:hypothetical protein